MVNAGRLVRPILIYVLALALFLSLILSSVGSNTVQQAQAAPAGFLKLGDYVQFGSYLGAPVVWRVINIDADNNPILFADKVISFKSFDSNGPLHKNADRKENGSNYYPDSNLRQWLNSTQKTITWTQNAPSEANVGGLSGFPYETESGFLSDSNFNEKERALIVPFTHKVTIAEYDASKKDGGTARHSTSDTQTKWADLVQNYDSTAFFKNVTDSVFLLSVKQAKEWVFDRGYPMITKPTQQAADQANKKANYLPKTPGYIDFNDEVDYWLSTPAASSTILTRYISTDNDNAYVDTPSIGWYGVRPALKLNLSAANFRAGGKGTLAAPHVVNTKGTMLVVGRSITINDKPLVLSATNQPVVQNGSTLVPFRAIFQALGMNVSYDAKTKTINASQTGYSIRLVIGSRTAVVNGTVNKTMPAAPAIIRGTTMVPLRFIGEETGLEVTFRAR